MSRNKKNAKALVHDVVMIAVGIAGAVILSKTGAIDFAVTAFKDYYILASFFAGIFFTSAFTLAPASIALVHIAENSPIGGVALWGGTWRDVWRSYPFLFYQRSFRRGSYEGHEAIYYKTCTQITSFRLFEMALPVIRCTYYCFSVAG